MQKIVIVTDAWEPQVNGVVRTYQNALKFLHGVHVIHPYTMGLKTIPLPGYKEIDVVVNPWKIKRMLWVAMYERRAIHVATEGPLGVYAIRLLRKHNYPYTTSFHSLFPEFIKKRLYVPTFLTYPFFRWFHKRSRAVLVPSEGTKQHLEERGFNNVKVWGRGVDYNLFKPIERNKTQPYIVCVSRVSQEKGLDDFCKLKYPRKVLVGDGPYLDTLQKKYKDVEFVGKKQGRELADIVGAASAFVFPSKSDTFGIVILESLACGVPVAAYDQPGPRECIINGTNGFYGDNLQENLNKCLTLSAPVVYNNSSAWSWQSVAHQFENYVLQTKN